jgi:hypothetical protein
MTTAIMNKQIKSEACEMIQTAIANMDEHNMEQLSQIIIDAATAMNRAAIHEYSSAENELAACKRRLARI